MFNLIKLTIGAVLFSLGILHGTPGIVSMFVTLIGCLFICRPMSLDYSGPGYFLVGILPFIPCYFLLEAALINAGVTPFDAGHIRIAACLVSGVFSFLSVPK